MSNNRAVIFLWIAAAFLAQAAVSYCLPALATPAILLTTVVFFGLHGGPRQGAWAGFLAGALLELYAYGGMGQQLLLTTVAGALSGWAAKQFFRDSVFSTVLIPMACNWAYLACGDLAAAGAVGWPGAGLFEPTAFASTLAVSAGCFAALKKAMVRRVGRSLRWS